MFTGGAVGRDAPFSCDAVGVTERCKGMVSIVVDMAPDGTNLTPVQRECRAAGPNEFFLIRPTEHAGILPRNYIPEMGYIPQRPARLARIQDLKRFFGVGHANNEQALLRIRQRREITVFDVDASVTELLRNPGKSAGFVVC